MKNTCGYFWKYRRGFLKSKNPPRYWKIPGGFSGDQIFKFKMDFEWFLKKSKIPPGIFEIRKSPPVFLKIPPGISKIPPVFSKIPPGIEKYRGGFSGNQIVKFKMDFEWFLNKFLKKSKIPPGIFKNPPRYFENPSRYFWKSPPGFFGNPKNTGGYF